MPQAGVRSERPQRNREQVDPYRLFAYLFGPPAPDRFQRLQRPELGNLLSVLWEEFGCEGEFAGLDGFRDYQQYEALYIALFDVGVPEPPVPLQESAHVRSQPAQQTALENTFFYEVLGLEVDPTRYPPDHLVTQLEFLAAVGYAREQTPSRENRSNLARLERDFLKRHLLDWLPEAQKKLERERPPLFPLLLRLLVAFLRRRLEELQRDESGAR